MKQNFTCPNCRTSFSVDLPETVPMVMCPACGTTIRVEVDEIGTVQSNLRNMALREGNWILWAAAAFALVWGGIVLVMVLANRRNAQQASAPPAAPVIVPTPAPAPARPIAPPAPGPIAIIPTTFPVPKPAAPKLHIQPHKLALSDAEIVKSIQKGVDFLLSNFTSGEINPSISNNIAEAHGIDALAVYALLHCSQSMRDDRISLSAPGMRQMVEHLKHFNFSASTNWNDPVTYSRSLRASALAIYNRAEDREPLESDLAWLLRAAEDGAFGYDDVYIRKSQKASKKPIPPSPPGVHSAEDFRWDNSNSQYGLIGVWNCAEAGLSVPNRFWQEVEQHWISCQTPQGTWDYQSGQGTNYAMTMGGITALSVCRDFMNDPSTQPALPGAARLAPRGEALEKAMRWFDSGDNSVNVQGQYGYSLYGLERAALASGMMSAGTHDIYRELAMKLVKDQLPNGAWRSDSGRDAVIETSFALLFLARGRNPVLVNKLHYDGNWDNHQRDAANLARYATYAMERPVNWQIATLTQPWGSWMEAPILYIAGDTPPEFGPADLDRLKNYVDNGGMIITHSDNGSEAFTAFAQNLAAKLYPKFEMTPVNDDDDLWTLQFKLPYPHYRLRAVSNGSRKLMIHCVDDVAGRWQANDPKRDRAAFELGLNLFVYATGKADLRTKTDSPFIPAAESGSSGGNISVARIQYNGNWEPEPAAWDRFARYFWWDTGCTVQPSAVLATELKFSDYPIAHLTGTGDEKPTIAQAQAISKFVREGGTLIIDSCGGGRAFVESVKNYWLPAIAPEGSAPHILGDDDPILTGQIPGAEEGATELPRILLRPYAAQVSKPANTHLLRINYGKGRIYFTELDLTTGLLGTNTWGITGFSPSYAQALMKNLILDTMTRPTEQP